MKKKLLAFLFPAPKPTRRQKKALTLESLESRDLFSASPGPFTTRSSPVSDNVSNLRSQAAQISTFVPSSTYQDIESNNSMASANNVGTFSTGSYLLPVIYGHIGRRLSGSVDSQDWYKIEVQGQTEASFTLSSMTQDLDLYLFNSQGTVITQSLSSGTRAEVINRTLEPGTYYVQVRQFFGSVSTYTLRTNLNVQATTPPPVTPPGLDVEPNNQLTQASTIGSFSAGIHTRTITGNVGAAVSGTADSQDWYRFEVSGRTTTQLRLSGLAQDLDLLLYDSAGTEINRSENIGSQDDVINMTLEMGTYFVQIRQYGLANSAYTLQMNLDVQAVTPPGPDVEPNNERSQASVIGLFSAGTHTRTITGNVGATVSETVDRQDWYRFEVSGRTTTQLRLSGLTQDLDLLLYNSAGAEINRSGYSGSQDEVINVTLEPGTYFVQIRQYGLANSAYTLQLDLNVQVLTPPNPNAQAIYLGNLPRYGQTWRSQPSGQISNSRRETFYSFDNDSTRSVGLDLRSISADLDIELQNADGVTVARSTNSGTARDRITASIAPGRWFIRVYQGTFSANSRFDLRVTPLS